MKLARPSFIRESLKLAADPSLIVFAGGNPDPNYFPWKELQENPGVKFIYTIPDFQNPTGKVLARERRIRMVELAEKYDTIIVEDNPYYFLRYDGEVIPPIKHFDKYERVVYLGSTSKILCPALRIGWMIGHKDILDGKPDEIGLDVLTPDDARRYIEEKQFAPGSMLPKVQAAMSFAESKSGRVALITLLEKAKEGIEGKTGTRVQM